jgi:phosphatidylserine/phosphatidylglycerophosphate/cardiolipin synthase-like enzyme
MQIVPTVRRWKRFSLRASAACALVALAASPSAAREELCDPSFQDCRAPLLTLIKAETTEIDVGLWFMTDARYSNLLVQKQQAGVKIRILMDPREFAQDPVDKTIMDQLQSGGIPMRKRIAGGIEHWKAMIFAGQNTVYFGSANFDPLAFVPNQPYENYADETVYFTDDASVVNSFMTKFDDAWTDTTSYANYANVVGPLTRSYPISTIDPELNFPPGQDFANRSVGRYNAETQKIDVDMFRITDQRHTNAIINAVARGIPVRLLADPDEYRLPTRLWDAWNVDRLYTAGVTVRMTVHQGLNHSKLVLLYGQGMSIFGSSNWTTPSANSQHEHNYFTKNASIFSWFVDYFERRWNNSSPGGFVESGPFTPLPPDKPVYQTPANSTVGLATTAVNLVWDGGPWAHVYDIYFGTSPTPPLFAPNQTLGPDDPTKGAPQYQSFTLPTLSPGTTYYWQIVSKTMANQTKAGPVFSFTTAGTPPPPPPGATTVVMWTANVPAANIHGNWTRISDATAAGGSALENPDAAQAKVAPALSSPANYFEQTFSAVSGADYHLWVRMRAQNNSLSNDSIHVQFSDSVDSVGTSVMRIGSTSSAEVVLQAGPSGAPDHGWGWADNGWGSPGIAIRFASDGAHTIRVQQREDGAIVDQIVLSPDTYVSAAPGPRTDDATILPNTDGDTPPPPPPPPPSNTIVLWLGQTPTAGVHGNWQALSDTTAAGGTALWNPDAGSAKIAPALASPTNFIETTFTANAGTAYHVWIRMRAQNNSFSNDSVHVQYSDSVTSSGAAFAQIGTTSSTEFVLQDGPNGAADQGWGWTDNGWGALGPNLFFATSGPHTLRIQQREDGAAIDQIVISPDTYLSSSPGARQNDATILPNTNDSAPPPSSNTIVLLVGQTPTADIHGNWQVLGDMTAAGGNALWNPDGASPKIAPALASPTNFVETAFSANAGEAYHVWIRMRAQNNSFSNDSVHIQYSDSVDSAGNAFAQIGTTSSTEFVLQDGPKGAADQGWGWTDNGWGALGPNLLFATSGTHTLRIQQREDGAIVDQIVLSPDTYLTSSPGGRQNDTTILPASSASGG